MVAGRPAERIVYEGPELEIGTFFVSPGQRCFHDTGPIERHIVVFPRTTVWIQHAGQEAFLSDVNHVCYYNRGQVYRRDRVDALGDRCEWFAPRGALLRDLIEPNDPGAADRPERPFRFRQGPSDRGSVCLERLVIRHLLEDDAPDALFVEEAACVILGRLVAAACQTRSTNGKAKRHADLIVEARRLLWETHAQPMSLGALAGRLGVSSFHLCRVFRAATGRTLHAYREQLRLRLALERVPGESDLTSLALDLGYSSHSHFTAAFRRAFGMPPREWRARASGARLRTLAEGLANEA